MSEPMETCHKKYLEHVKKIVPQYSHVVIYGAGRKAIGLYEFLTENNVTVQAFTVTDANENKSEEHGVPIYGIENLPYDNQSTIILLGVRKRWNEEIIEKIKENGYKNYIESPNGIEYFLSKDENRSVRPVLQMTVQIGCKIDCRFCPQEKFVKLYTKDMTRKRDLSFEDYKEFVDKTDQNVIIDFAGFTEPFFNKDCADMICYAHEKGHEVELFTTLVGMTEKDFEQIKEIPFREVVLHIPDEKVNSHIPITKEYLALLQTVLDTKRSNGKPFVDWASCHSEPHPAIEPMIRGKLRVITKMHDRAGNLEKEDVEKIESLSGKIQCSGAPNLNHNVMLPDGTVILCDSDWGMQHILGSLRNQTYDEILNGKELKKIRQWQCEDNGKLLCRQCCYAISQEEK